MSWRLNDVQRLEHATGRRLLRVAAAGDDEVEFVFERHEGEAADVLVTIRLTLPPAIGEIDLPRVEERHGIPKYGLGVEV